MNKKTVLQLFLFLVLVLMSYIFFQKYFSVIDKKSFRVSSNNTDNILINSKNLIKDIQYNSINKNGDSFTIKADFGEVDTENTDNIFMTNVRGSIKEKIK